ncbi:hypothetical protein GUJ93_ZPchr0013g35594 [Zizania palustris]|uniref:PAP-specific phosphatase, mitochondrial n=1 Tax=Zizania palustris TaxID=103762 RepID=A0A8J5X887_ZIZPA|nr:hypothetical protein GUJ93_ZPchr0013g35594 [Zizania palustris]
MPLLHLSLPPHRLLLVGRRRRLLLPLGPSHPRVCIRAVAAASAAAEAYGLPFPPERAAHHRELAAAAAAVERACRLCVDVKRSLLSGDERILEKKDQTPVTVADFGVQALISLELQRSFPSIPLVAEEDSASVRSNNVLVESISSAVADKVSSVDSPLTHDDVLRAIDRGGKDGVSFDSSPATYWVLDPIDGTKGFLGGDDALYVVGLALVVNGKVVIGVMGCPNWANDTTMVSGKDDMGDAHPDRGILMVAHVGCGTWSRCLSVEIGRFTTAQDTWNRCLVDSCSIVHKARFCISDSQSWDMIPLSALFNSTIDESNRKDENEILLLYVYCGRLVCCSSLPGRDRSLCKYLTIASGKASVFVLRAHTKTIKSWDHAVGVICVQEAGGQISDWSGKPLDLAADLTGRREQELAEEDQTTQRFLPGQVGLPLWGNKPSWIPSSPRKAHKRKRKRGKSLVADPEEHRRGAISPLPPPPGRGDRRFGFRVSRLLGLGSEAGA